MSPLPSPFAVVSPSASTAGIAFAVAAALLYGAYLYGYKRYFSDLPAMAYLTVTEGAAAVWYLPAVATVDRAALARLEAIDWLAVVATALLTGAAIAVSIRAIQLGDVSYVTPLNKLVPAFVLPLEIGLLGAVLTPLQVAGVVAATAGIYLANYEADGVLAPLARALAYRPAQLALAGAAAFAVVDVMKRVLLQDLSLPLPVVVWVSLVGIAAVAAPLGWRRRGDLPVRLLPVLVAVGAVLAVGDHTIALAFQRLPASVASPVINGQAVVAVVLGGLLLDERAFPRRLAASLLAIAGIALVALG